MLRKKIYVFGFLWILILLDTLKPKQCTRCMYILHAYIVFTFHIQDYSEQFCTFRNQMLGNPSILQNIYLDMVTLPAFYITIFTI